MSESEFELDLEELNSAEEFLNYFGVDFEPSVVYVNRLHILQRFHDYIDGVGTMPEADGAKFDLYAELLEKAYQDFVDSDARTEKVFKVFRMFEPVDVRISIAEFKRQVFNDATEI
ncbi:MAG: nitrogenase-stabilizing/protective protein NifW [Gammaproteobacteria bacterium]|nr:nitrogenase-stabilizing/protective protein NifW [Gammaproteobacteria bacterium]